MREHTKDEVSPTLLDGLFESGASTRNGFWKTERAPLGSAVNGARPRPIMSHSPNRWIAANDPLPCPRQPVPRVAHQGAVGV
jgi:hypothetical protein